MILPIIHVALDTVVTVNVISWIVVTVTVTSVVAVTVTTDALTTDSPPTVVVVLSVMV